MRLGNTILNPEKKSRNGGESPTPIAMSLATTQRSRQKASLNLNFHNMFCAIIKAAKTRNVYNL